MIHNKTIQYINLFLSILKYLLVILMIFLSKSKGLLEQSIATTVIQDNSFTPKRV